MSWNRTERGLRFRGFAWIMAMLFLDLSVRTATAASLEAELVHQRFEVSQNKAIYIDVPQDVDKISMANPEIAEVILVRPRKLLVHGNKLGTSNILLWNRQGKVFDTIDITVTHDLETIRFKLHQALPGENIRVISSGKKLVLSGTVSSLPKLDAAIRLAQGFLDEASGGAGVAGGTTTGADPAAGPIVNLLSVGGAQQVMLEVKVAEVARTLLKRLDVKFRYAELGGDVRGGIAGPGAMGGGIPGFTPTITTLPTTITPASLFPALQGAGAFLSYFNGERLVSLTIDAAKDNGLVKLLAEPTLTTQTGEKASFLSGGEFPIPVAQGGAGAFGAISVQFKTFGVGVEFLPVVLDSGRISLKTNISVSELSNEAAAIIRVPDSNQSFAVPSLRTRMTSSTLEVADGQTLAIAGLIDNNTREAYSRFPGLGDLPVLGALFRSQEFQKRETELVIFATPHLARPVPRDEIRLPTDDFIEPDDVDFYLLGKMQGVTRNVRPYQNLRPLESRLRGGLEGSFGHDVN